MTIPERDLITDRPSSDSAGSLRGPRRLYHAVGMAKAKRNWIQEERRQTLGDWVSFCLACGHVQRYFEPDESELAAACPFCEGEMRHRCPSCNARFPSAFQVECEDCGAELRPNELFGVPIRRAGR